MNRSTQSESTKSLAAALGLQVSEHQPFAWQNQLLFRFLDGDTPHHLDIPTGLGKNAGRIVGSRNLLNPKNKPYPLKTT